MKKLYPIILILSFLTFFVKAQNISDQEYGAVGYFSESILTGESVPKMALIDVYEEAVINFTGDKIMTERETQILQETSVIPKFLQTPITETPRSMSCMPGATYSNAPENYKNVINCNTSVGYRGAQRVTGFEYPIGAIRIFGIQSFYQGAYIPAEHVDPMNFELKFFSDDNGLPGVEITDLAEEILLDHYETGVMFANSFNIFYWEYEPESPIEGLPDIFWISIANTESDSWFMWLDAIGGQDKSMQQLMLTGTWLPNDNAFSLCLVPVLPDPGAPGKPTGLNAVAGDLGALTASISWTNPTETFGGETLTNLDKITLEVNGMIEKEYYSPAIGDDLNYIFTATEVGSYKFTVYGTNSEGDGAQAKMTIWVGEDVPAAPKNVVLEAIADGGKVTWDTPTDGLNGGYLDETKIVYTVIRLPNTMVAENITVTEYVDNTIPRIANYRYKVIASNDTGKGGETLSNVAPLGAEGILFFEDFSFVTVGELPEGWIKEGEQAAVWGGQNTFQAGYEPPELRLDHGPYFNGLSRLVTHSFGTDGNESLRLKFGHFFSYYGLSGNTLAVQVSFDDGVWNDLWRKELTRDFGPEEVECYFSVPNGATTMRLGLEFNGNINSINYYSFDNAIVEPVVANDLTAKSITGNPTPTVGDATTYKIAVQNVGNDTQTNYTVKLMREGGIELASMDGVQIAFAETKEFEFTWTPTAADEGAVKIYGEVVPANDELASNNRTSDFLIAIQPEGIVNITIGQGETQPDVHMPFDFFNWNSLTQTIYYADEIGVESGGITTLAYTNSFASNLENKRIMVWMGETDQNNLNNGWIPLDGLTLVYDGTMTFPSGDNTIVIPLDNPYIYSGGNLVIYSNRVWENAWYGRSDKFYGTLDTGSKRSRQIAIIGDELNPANPGVGAVNDWYPNTTIFLNPEGFAEIIGNVVDADTGDPVEGVKVETQNAKAKTFTNADGEFGFTLLAGTYNFSFEKFGYISKVVEGIELEADELDITSLANVQLTPVPQYEVTGTIKGNDNLFLESAVVKLMGYDSYEVTTNAQGEFTFNNVYAGTYSVKVSLDGYEAYTAEGIEVNADTQLGLIVLIEKIITPIGLAVDIFNQNTGEALFTWITKENEFRYDDDTVDGQLGFAEGSLNDVVGAVHRNNAKLSSISWLLTDEGGPHASVKIWILGLNADGKPNKNDVLYSQEGVPNTDKEWNIFIFPEMVEAPNGFFMGISYAGFVGLAVDTGVDTEWPFVPKANYAGSIVTGQFFSLEDVGYPVNYLIRATGIDYGTLRIDTQSHYGIGMVTDLTYIKNENPIIAQKTSTIPSSRVFQGFNIYLNDMETPVATEIQNAEYLFTSLGQGDYTAGVKAIYSTGSSELATINFIMDYGVKVDVNITTNSGDSPKGAEVILANDNHIYTGVANADGEVEFQKVYKGIYNLTVSLDGHETYRLQNINIHEDKVFEVELKENIVVPYGLMVEQLNNNIDVKFSWNNFLGFIDDFESYEDFISSDIGDYTLYDGDGSATYGFTGIDFPNTYYSEHYIIFNPTQTNPPMDSDAIQPRSGEKFIAAFAAQAGPNNDWLITPKISVMNGMKFSFWAKTYMDDYGMEEFKVAISTTDTNPESFDFITDIIQAPVTHWGHYEYDLSDYSGQDIYAAIVCVSNEVFVLMVDDLGVNVGSKMGENVLGYTQTTYAHSNVQNTSKAFLGFEVYLDGQLVSDEPISAEQFTFKGLDMEESYVAGVKSVYSSGESEMQTLIFTTETVNVMDNPLSILTTYPNPFDKYIAISNPDLVKRIVVINSLGQPVMDIAINGDNTFKTESLAPGIYLISLQGDNGEILVRRMVKK